MDKEFILSKKFRERLESEIFEGQVASEEVIKMLEDIREALKKEEEIMHRIDSNLKCVDPKGECYKEWMNWFFKLDKEVD